MFLKAIVQKQKKKIFHVNFHRMVFLNNPTALKCETIDS